MNLTAETIAHVTRGASDREPIAVRPTKLVLAHPWNTTLGKATALRIIIARLAALGENVSAYKRELALCE